MRFLKILILILSIPLNALAQIIYTSEDYGTHLRSSETGGISLMVPLQNVNYDQWKMQMVPVDGIEMLLVIVFAYAVFRGILKSRKTNR